MTTIKGKVRIIAGLSSPTSTISSSSPSPVRSDGEPCSVCLNTIEGRSVVNNCFHEFCFNCITEWSKIKSVCPLCKQPFKTILHNIRSDHDFDLYTVTSRAAKPVEIEDRSFRYRTTQTFERRNVYQRRLSARLTKERYQRSSASELISRSRWNDLDDDRAPAATSSVRRSIYDMKLWSQGTVSIPKYAGMVRDVSPLFLSSNPACCHRLWPWLNREINALGIGKNENIYTIVNDIVEFIKRHDILSEEFYKKFQPLFKDKTKHFVHEFHSYAKSPFNMEDYDRNVIYGTPPVSRTEEVLISDSDDDIEILDVVRPQEQTSHVPSTSESSSSHQTTSSNNTSDVVETVSSGTSSASGSCDRKRDRSESQPDSESKKLKFKSPSASSVTLAENLTRRSPDVPCRQFYSSDESDEESKRSTSRSIRSEIGLNLLKSSLFSSSSSSSSSPSSSQVSQERKFKKHSSGHKNRSNKS